MFKSEYHSFRYRGIDKIVCLYVLSTIVTYTLLWQTTNAFIYRLGGAYYILGTYFLFRFYITDISDVDRVVKCLLYLSVVISFFVFLERAFHQNYFLIFGGEQPYKNMIRDGEFRCYGPFSHPITLGSFGAFLLPLAFYMLWEKKAEMKLGIVSLISCLIIVLFSNSSGPILSALSSIFGLSMWAFRKHMRIIRWGILFSIIGLHIVMEGPVWAIINKIGVLTGSSHYHRFLLIDQCIKRLNEWWLIGVKSTEHWHLYVATFDVSNNYVRIGVDGGLFALVLFVVIIALCFRHIGWMLLLAQNNVKKQKMFWSLGVAMFSYCISFMGVSLWDQTIMIWYFIIAMIASLTYNDLRKLKEEGA